MSRRGFTQATEQLVQWLTQRTLSANTVRSYQQTVGKFLAWADAEGLLVHIRDLEEIGLDVYLDQLAKGRKADRKEAVVGLRQTSVIQARRIISSYLNHLVRLRTIRASPAWHLIPAPLPDNEGATRSVGRSKNMTRNSMSAVAPVSGDVGLTKSRCLIIANLAFWCSATTSEIAALQFKHLHFRKKPATLKLGEGTSHARVVILPEHLKDLLNDYLCDLDEHFEELEIARSGYLIVDMRTGEPVSAWTIWRLCKEATGTTENQHPPQWYRSEFCRHAEHHRFVAGVIPAQRGNAKWVVPRAARGLAETDLLQVVSKFSMNAPSQAK